MVNPRDIAGETEENPYQNVEFSGVYHHNMFGRNRSETPESMSLSGFLAQSVRQLLFPFLMFSIHADLSKSNLKASSG